MSLTPLYLFSGLICLFWIAVHAILARRLRTFVLFCYLFGTIVITACGDVLSETLFGSEAIAHMVVQFMAPTIIPLCCFYFQKMKKDIRFGPIVQFWVIIPAGLFTSALMLTLLNGLQATDAFIDRIHDTPIQDLVLVNSWERIYYLSTIVLFRVVMIAEALLLLVFSFNLSRRYLFGFTHFWRFLFKGQRISVMEIQVSLAIWITFIIAGKLFLHPYFSHAPGWSVAISIVIGLLYFLFGLFALFGARNYITLEDVRTALRFNYAPESQAQVTESMIMDMANGMSGESLTRVLARLNSQGSKSSHQVGDGRGASLSSAIFKKDPQGWEPDSLAARFQHLMQEQQLFLLPRLTLDDVAKQLKTNKTYVSKMVNQNYNIGFPEVLNIMRVDYSCEYIRRHPQASQEDVARACGFLSASTFNSTFKRVTGYTPKVWAARMDSSSGL